MSFYWGLKFGSALAGIVSGSMFLFELVCSLKGITWSDVLDMLYYYVLIFIFIFSECTAFFVIGLLTACIPCLDGLIIIGGIIVMFFIWHIWDSICDYNWTRTYGNGGLGNSDLDER